MCCVQPFCKKYLFTKAVVSIYLFCSSREPAVMPPLRLCLGNISAAMSHRLIVKSTAPQGVAGALACFSWPWMLKLLQVFCSSASLIEKKLLFAYSIHGRA